MPPLFRSVVGKKILVAITGLVMLGFVVGHLLGNLQIYEGPEKINAYAEFIHHRAVLLWGTRFGLLISVLVHGFFSAQLAHQNREGRPVPYQKHEMIQATLSSRFMVSSGLFLGAYIIFHLLHLTFGVIHPNLSEPDVYRNVITGFQVVPVAIGYIAAMVALGVHLHHGIFSAFQTLGLNHPNFNPWRRLIAVGAAVIIAGGFMSIPLAVMFGFLR